MMKYTGSDIYNDNDDSLEDSMTFVGRFPVSLARLSVLSLWVWGLLGLWVGRDLGVLEVIGLGLSSSGLSEDNEDPVEDPRIWRDSLAPGRGRRRSLSFILSMSSLSPVTLLLEA